MSGHGERTEVRIVCCEKFWETLAPYRRQASYAAMRAKIREMVAHRLAGMGRHPREKPFVGDKLKGFWHLHLSERPPAILFYEQHGGGLRLLMVADHSEYGWGGKNLRGEACLARRLEGLDRGHRASPFWPDPVRWSTPEELARHPDVPELSPAALDAAMEELEDEALECRRYATLHGGPPRDAAEAEAYVARCIAAHDALSEVRRLRLGADHDARTGWSRFAMA